MMGWGECKGLMVFTCFKWQTEKAGVFESPLAVLVSFSPVSFQKKHAKTEKKTGLPTAGEDGR